MFLTPRIGMSEKHTMRFDCKVEFGFRRVFFEGGISGREPL